VTDPSLLSNVPLGGRQHLLLDARAEIQEKRPPAVLRPGRQRGDDEIPADVAIELLRTREQEGEHVGRGTDELATFELGLLQDATPPGLRLLLGIQGIR
jgi:hypothetical protein